MSEAGAHTGPYTGSDVARQALDAVPGIPRDAEGPVFREPWEAQSFAIVLGLYRRGLFTWKEWTDALVAEIQRAQQAGDPDTGETYYRHWLAALERIVVDKGITDDATLGRYRKAWCHAAARTPHGMAIAIKPADFDSDSRAGS